MKTREIVHELRDIYEGLINTNHKHIRLRLLKIIEQLQSHSQPRQSAEEIIRDFLGNYGRLPNSVKEIESLLHKFAQQDIEYNKIQNQFKVIESIQEYNQQDIELPSDEEIEKWWASETDDKFWHAAPYRTNGDVIEEIKDAVRYFMSRKQLIKNK